MNDWRDSLDHLHDALDHIDGADEEMADVELALASVLRAWQDLHESESRYRLFIEQSSDGIWRTDHDGPVDVTLPVERQVEAIYATCYIADANDALARQYGYARGREMIGLRLSQIQPPDDPVNRATTRAYVENRYRLVNQLSHEVGRDGRRRTFANTCLGRVESGLLVRTWGVQREVTPRLPTADVARALDELAADPRLPPDLAERLRQLGRAAP